MSEYTISRPKLQPNNSRPDKVCTRSMSDVVTKLGRLSQTLCKLRISPVISLCDWSFFIDFIESKCYIIVAYFHSLPWCDEVIMTALRVFHLYRNVELNSIAMIVVYFKMQYWLWYMHCWVKYSAICRPSIAFHQKTTHFCKLMFTRIFCYLSIFVWVTKCNIRKPLTRCRWSDTLNSLRPNDAYMRR